MIIVLKKITASQLNISLQICEFWELAIGDRQRAAYSRIAGELPTHKHTSETV